MITDQTKSTPDSTEAGGATFARPSMSRFLLLSVVLAIASFSSVRWGLYLEVRDGHDIDVYLERGSWWPEGLVPYSGVFSEYPEIATWFFAIPYMVIAGLQSAAGIVLDDGSTYRYIFTFLMAIFLAGTITLLHAMRTDRRWYAYLMLLPSILYFSHNRYDVMPAFFVVLALFLLQRSHFYWAFGVLGIATMTKWYPMVILPVFISYLWRRNRQATLKGILVFGVVVAAIVTQTLLTAGLDGFLVPYKFHAARVGDSQSLLTMLSHYTILDRTDSLTRHVFEVLQFLPALVVLFVRIKSWRVMIAWSAVTVLSFVLFSSVYSPQWIVWVAPLFILVAAGALDVVLLVAYNITNSLMYPFAFHLQRHEPTFFRATVIANLIMMAAWLLRVGWIALAGKDFDSPARVEKAPDQTTNPRNETDVLPSDSSESSPKNGRE